MELGINNNINSIVILHTMKNTDEFIKRQNIELLWEILLDELGIDLSNKQVLQNIRLVFEKNIGLFTAKANPNVRLVELNKLFLKQITIALNTLFPSLRTMKRINIGEEFPDKPYKIEDIHSVRQNQFEKQLEQKRLDFEVTMNPGKPNEMDFTDKFQETKITSMDSLIAETVAKRNFDIEQIQYSNNSSNQSADWLSPKETSLKTEKQQQYENVKKEMQNSKFLAQQPQENNKGKNVTWDDNISFEIDEKQPENETISNIFSKLKKNVEVETEVVEVEEQKKENILMREILDMKEEIKNLNAVITMMREEFQSLNKNIEKMSPNV